MSHTYIDILLLLAAASSFVTAYYLTLQRNLFYVMLMLAIGIMDVWMFFQPWPTP